MGGALGAVKLTPKHERFVQEYLLDLNGTHAAIRAGYSKRSAANSQRRLLDNPKIQQRIQELMNRRADRVEINQDKVLQECAHVALSDVGDLFDDNGRLLPIKQMPANARRTISSIEVVTKVVSGAEPMMVEYVHKFRLWDKMSGLEKLGKHLKLFDRAAESDANEIAKQIRAMIAPSMGLPKRRK